MLDWCQLIQRLFSSISWVFVPVPVTSLHRGAVNTSKNQYVPSAFAIEEALCDTVGFLWLRDSRDPP